MAQRALSMAEQMICCFGGKTRQPKNVPVCFKLKWGLSAFNRNSK